METSLMIVETVWLHVFITEGGESITMGENAVERPGAFVNGVVGFETDAEKWVDADGAARNFGIGRRGNCRRPRA